MINLEDMLQRVASGLADSEELRDWCQSNCGAAPRVAVLPDPEDQDTSHYTPMLIVLPAVEDGAGAASGADIDVDVVCRVANALADTSQGAAGTSLRVYRAAATLIGLARQALAAVDLDLDGTNASIDRHRIDRFALFDKSPLRECVLRLSFKIPAILGADLDLDPEE